jgi:transposase-like protein
MAELTYHQFGELVECSNCGMKVNGVWSWSWDAANAGEGLCDDCFMDKSKPAKKAVTVKMVKPEETKDDDAR